MFWKVKVLDRHDHPKIFFGWLKAVLPLMVQQTVLLKFPCCAPVEHPTKMNKGRMNEVVIWIDLTEPSMSLAPLVLSCHLVNISEFTYITLKFNHLFRHSDISKLFPGSFISQKKTTRKLYWVYNSVPIPDWWSHNGREAENQSLREKLARLGHSPADLQGSSWMFP